MSEMNQQIILAHRPIGEPQASDFRWVETAVPEIGDGQFLVRSHYLSLDPYMRGRMSEAKSYAKPVELGEVMIGEAVGEVVTSRHPKFKTGDIVAGTFGWQLYAVSDGAGVRWIMDRSLPLSAYLGVVGMPGVTAYIGLLDIGQPKSGETVVVSAAGGAVGGVVGQIAKIHGCRAVGIAGGPEKCHYVVEDLGFDACVDYKAGRLREDVKETTPQGIDVYFDNVGGEILDTILSRMNPFGRIPLCGVISQYNAAQPYGVKNTRSLLINRIKLQGFLVFDYSARWPAAIEVLSQWVSEGKIKYRETVAAGLQSAPEAFIGMLAGKNFGKQIVNLICKCSQPSSPRTFPGTGKSRKRVSAANVAQEAAYWTTTVDSTGRALRGQHNYVLHFPSGQLPPNNAVVVIGRVLVESDSDVSTADGLAKQIQLRPLNQE